MALQTPETEQSASEAAPGTGEHRCLGCGYAAVAASAPNACPMCHEDKWEWHEWRPFSRTNTLPETRR